MRSGQSTLAASPTQWRNVRFRKLSGEGNGEGPLRGHSRPHTRSLRMLDSNETDADQKGRACKMWLRILRTMEPIGCTKRSKQGLVAMRGCKTKIARMHRLTVHSRQYATYLTFRIF